MALTLVKCCNGDIELYQALVVEVFPAHRSMPSVVPWRIDDGNALQLVLAFLDGFGYVRECLFDEVFKFHI